MNKSAINSLIKTLENNQNFLTFIVSIFIFYINNMENYIYVIYFLIVLIPQIIRNCRIGNKINYKVESLMLITLPKILPLTYLRILGTASLFKFEPHYFFTFVCLSLIIAANLVLFVQKKHGARSILPKFLFPKGFKSKFKFFSIQD